MESQTFGLTDKKTEGQKDRQTDNLIDGHSNIAARYLKANFTSLTFQA